MERFAQSAAGRTGLVPEAQRQVALAQEEFPSRGFRTVCLRPLPPGRHRAAVTEKI